MLEIFKLLPSCCFVDRGEQFAYVGNIAPFPYIRLCHQEREGESMQPLVGILATLGSSAVTDRFRMAYINADEEGRDKLSPKLAIGLAAEIIKAAKWDDEFEEWLINIDYDAYYNANINPRSLHFTPEQEKKRAVKHIETEQGYWEQTQHLWQQYNNESQKAQSLFKIVKNGVEDYLQRKAKRSKGRPPKVDWIKGDAEQQQRTLDLLKIEIGNKSASFAYLVLLAAMRADRITLPSSPIACKTFPSITKTAYKQQMQKTYKDLPPNQRQVIDQLTEKFKQL